MISLLQLKYFQALAREPHLTQTAQKLFISQTTLSVMIAKLERELGTTLFDRESGRGIRLNKNGAQYLQYVDAALQALADGEALMKAQGRRESGNSISLAVSGTNGWGHIVLQFRTRFPQYEISLQSEAMPGLRSNLVSGQLDMAIVGEDDLCDPLLAHTVLQEGRIYAYLPHGHRLAGRSAIYMADLADEPIISPFHELPYAMYCDGLFRKAGLIQNVAMECDFSMRPRLLEEGAGIALVYGPSAEQPLLRQQFQGFDHPVIMDDFAVRRLALFWKKGRVFSPAMTEFYRFVTENGFSR